MYIIVHVDIHIYKYTSCTVYLQMHNEVHTHTHVHSRSMKAYGKKIKNNFKLAVTPVVKERGKKLRKNSPNHRGLQLYLWCFIFFILIYWFLEKEKKWEGGTDSWFHLRLQSLADSCMCPEQGQPVALARWDSTRTSRATCPALCNTVFFIKRDSEVNMEKY